MDEKAELSVLLCEAGLIFFLHAFLQNSIFWMGKRCWELDGREKRTIKLKSQGIFFSVLKAAFLSYLLFTYLNLLVELIVFYGNTSTFLLTHRFDLLVLNHCNKYYNLCVTK